MDEGGLVVTLSKKERQTKVIFELKERWPPDHNYPEEKYSSCEIA